MSRTRISPHATGWLALSLALAALCAPVLAQRTFTDVGTEGLPDNGCLDDAIGKGLGEDDGRGIVRTIVVRAGGGITDVDVALRMTHTWRSDIQVGLIYVPVVGPSLGLVELVNGHDDSADNYIATFDSDAATPCSAATDCGNSVNCATPPGPTCRPNESLDAFDGASAPGHFVLNICDRTGVDLGTLDQWSVVVSGVTLTFDVDGDGAVEALTDGLLFLRYAFGFRGATLVTGAVGGACTRCAAPAIEAYLGSL